MPGHISYPRTAAIANAWSNYRDAVALLALKEIDSAVEILKAILADPAAPADLKRQAAELLNKYQDHRTYPTGDEGGVPFGKPTTVREGINRASDMAENDCARFLAGIGYKIEQLPEVSGPKDPDYRIEGRIFDHMGPETDNAGNIIKRLGRKRSKEQADRFVLDLNRSKVTIEHLEQALLSAFNTPGHLIEGTKEIMIIRDGEVIPFFPSRKFIKDGH